MGVLGVTGDPVEDVGSALVVVIVVVVVVTVVVVSGTRTPYSVHIETVWISINEYDWATVFGLPAPFVTEEFAVVTATRGF